jgi:hypothetical protein
MSAEVLELERVEVEFDDPESEPEVMTDPFDPTQIHIQVEQKSLDSLIARLKNDEIDMNTDFQRHADLWDPGKMSRLIESILIRFPLPAFYFDATDDNRWLIVDGLQRLSSIRRFVPMTEGGQGELALTGLEFLKDLKGKRYADIGRTYQRRIAEQQVTLYLIRPGTPMSVKYSVFRRINTGGLTLNYQEIRHAMAKPRERAFLNRLAADEFLIKTMGDQSKRMLAQELVLRFASFLQMDYANSKRNIARFLDDGLEMLTKMSEAELQRLESRFRIAMRASWDLFGADAFQKRTREESPRQRKNAALFEVWSVTLARLAERDPGAFALLLQRHDRVKQLLRAAVDEPEFFQAISMATQKKINVRDRFDRIERLVREVCDA